MALSSTEKLRRRLRNLAKREKHIVVFTGLLRVLMAIVVFGGMFFLVDWMLRLSVVFRLLCLGAGLAGLVWLVRIYIRTPLSVKRNEETVALKLENRFEYLNDRLISVIQLTRPGSEADKSAMSQSLISRLESDVADISYDIRFSEIFDWKFIRRIVLISLVIFSFALMSYASFPEYVMTTVKRMFLSSQNYPVLTRITVDEHKTKIVEGDDWTVNVSLAGEIPSSVYLRRKKTDTEEDWEEYELKPGLGYTYSLTLKKVRNTFDFRIYAGDGITDSVRVKVIKLLTISDPELDVTPPSYTGIDPVENVALSSAPLVESAEVRITVPANKELVSGRLLTAVGTAVGLKPDPSGVSASGRFIVRAEPLTGSSVRLNGTDKKVQVDHSGTLDCGKDNGDLTVELWLNLKQRPNGNWRIIVHKGSDKKERTFYMALHPRSNRIHYRISTDKSWNEGGDTEREVPVNRWTHIAYVKKDNVLELYINGERDSREQLSGAVKANEGPIHIGNSPWEKGVNAALDNLLIYSRALSQREVRNHYNNGLGTDSFSRKGLQAGYLFDGTEEDMSGNGNTARFINKPAVASGIVKSLRNIDGTKILCGRSGIVSFTVRLKDTDGLYNAEPLIRYSFRVKKDMSPKIRITYPGREQTSVPFARDRKSNV